MGEPEIFQGYSSPSSEMEEVVYSDRSPDQFLDNPKRERMNLMHLVTPSEELKSPTLIWHAEGVRGQKRAEGAQVNTTQLA
ncbi:hypothetical protein H6P81_004846 [Aristolochia fimbriata]|uniref:Uncharacterized protein n=1 Tax=Aristolochia fimbriata TaxID=158543 RepID=A0AAV7ESW8_ARIFI|nr:hypothetical protein H6P81_004846 [Aristolochia fimbriata]